MRRIAIIAIAAALFASTAAIALADDTDADPEASETSVFSEAQLWKAKLLADYVLGDTADPAAAEAITEVIKGLRTGEPAVGWGAMFKLLQLEKATGTSLADLLLAAEGQDGWAFGRAFRALTPDQRKNLDDTPKNFGQLKKQQTDPKVNQGKKPQDD